MSADAAAEMPAAVASEYDVWPLFHPPRELASCLSASDLVQRLQLIRFKSRII